MYEKPQYLTPDGYRRLPKNPFKGGVTSASGPASNRILSKREKGLLERHAAALSPIKKRKGISDEAAKAIAMAIKGMLKPK